MPLTPILITHARLRNEPRIRSEHMGLVGWTFDPADMAVTGPAPTTGKTYASMVMQSVSAGVNRAYIYVAVAGVGLTSGQCLLGLYDSSGSLLFQSGDLSAVLNSTGLKTVTLTPTPGAGVGTLGEGNAYFLGLLQNFSTSGAKLQCAGVASLADAAAAGLLSGGRFVQTSGTGTVLPNPLGATVDSANAFFGAIASV